VNAVLVDVGGLKSLREAGVYKYRIFQKIYKRNLIFLVQNPTL
jgi:hypothetical protein